MHRDVPRIPVRHIPAAEREGGYFVLQGLQTLESICSDVESAVALFEHTEAVCHHAKEAAKDFSNTGAREFERVSFKWPFTAAQSVAISVHHFGLTRGIINRQWKQLPTLAALVDLQAIRNSNALFQKYFPNTRMLRDAVCHAEDLFSTPTKARENAVNLGGTGLLMLAANLYGNELRYAKQGKEWGIEISRKTVMQLVEVIEVYFDAFRGIEAAIRERCAS